MVEVDFDSLDLFMFQSWYNRLFDGKDGRWKPKKREKELIDKTKVMYFALIREEEDDNDEDDHRKHDDRDDEEDDTNDDDGDAKPRPPKPKN